LEIDPFSYITQVLLNAGSAQTDEEWDMLDKVLKAYFDSEEDELENEEEA
jgi:hypothetical protein